MLILRFVVWMFLVGTIVLGASAVFSQDYPNKPIRMLANPLGVGLILRCV